MEKRRLINFLRRHGYVQHGRFFFKDDIRIAFRSLVVRVDLLLDVPRVVKFGNRKTFIETERLAGVYYKRLTFDKKGIPNGLGFHSIPMVRETMKPAFIEAIQRFFLECFWAR